MKNIIIRVKIVIERDSVGYHAYCPDLRGLHVDGTSEDDALSNAKDAVRAYVTSLVKHGDPIPVSINGKVGLKDIWHSIFPSRSSIEHYEDLALAA